VYVTDADPYMVCWFWFVFVVWCLEDMVCFSDITADCGIR
jgi:hypothetical protein